jgi:CBS domain-containing protein
VIAAAQSILDQGGWCVLEACTDVPRQRWEGRAVFFHLTAEAVYEAAEEEIAVEPVYDARLTGCNRRTLHGDDQMGAHLIYIAANLAPADSAVPAEAAVPVARPNRPTRRRLYMFVRDGMNPIVVTIGTGHNLREAARRMTARGVGAAVVLDDELPAPCIITERDILHSNGVGQSIDDELVREHLTSEVVYAAADWSLEQAAAAMVRGGFRHIIVLDGSDVVGILSMRDIVRCWTSEGASCEVVG